MNINAISTQIDCISTQYGIAPSESSKPTHPPGVNLAALLPMTRQSGILRYMVASPHRGQIFIADQTKTFRPKHIGILPTCSN